MIFTETNIKGLFVIRQNVSIDNRGSFCKNFLFTEFSNNNLENNFRESYYTHSSKNVIRGMHFQEPPYDHAKLITVINGTIIDVVLDIRKNSETYGQYFEIELSRENQKSLYIPKGLAHGFGVLSDYAIACYFVSSEYNQEHDKGIRYDSFGFRWPINDPIMSERDMTLPYLKNYTSPFYAGSNMKRNA
jgi:dTDP-4-dehydrorhamnose 3,5-epimerase